MTKNISRSVSVFPCWITSLSFIMWACQVNFIYTDFDHSYTIKALHHTHVWVHDLRSYMRTRKNSIKNNKKWQEPWVGLHSEKFHLQDGQRGQTNIKCAWLTKYVEYSHTVCNSSCFCVDPGILKQTSTSVQGQEAERNDVDQDVFLMFNVVNEGLSWYLEDNIQEFCSDPAGVNRKDPDFEESNLMHGAWWSFSKSFSCCLSTPHWLSCKWYLYTVETVTWLTLNWKYASQCSSFPTVYPLP